MCVLFFYFSFNFNTIKRKEALRSSLLRSDAPNRNRRVRVHKSHKTAIWEIKFRTTLHLDHSRWIICCGRSLIMMDSLAFASPRGLDGGQRGDSNAANGPSSRFATRLTIKFDFSWHRGNHQWPRASEISWDRLSKIISVQKRRDRSARCMHLIESIKRQLKDEEFNDRNETRTRSTQLSINRR